MDCERFDKTTMELLYGELDELSEAAAQRHLHHCTRCRDIWGQLRATRELADVPLEDCPEELFENIMSLERSAHNSLTLRERFSRMVSIMAGYAMRPQLAMAAILLLMIGSSLVFIRTSPTNRGQVSVTELGTPLTETPAASPRQSEALVFGREPEKPASKPRPEGESGDSSEKKQPQAADDVGDSLSRRAYSEAMAAYQDGRYAEAERLFSEVALNESSQAASAALHQGHAARNGSGCQRAAGLYDEIAKLHAGSTVADEASWHAASCYRALGRLKRASAHYSALAQRPAYASRAQAALKELEKQIQALELEQGSETNVEVSAAAGPVASARRSKKASKSKAKAKAKTTSPISGKELSGPASSTAAPPVGPTEEQSEETKAN